jgi:hypothetical protein
MTMLKRKQVKINKRANDPLERLIYEHRIYINGIVMAKEYDKIMVVINTGNTITIKISDFPRLKSATIRELNNWELISGGTGIHWNALDEDLSLKGFIYSIKPRERRTVIRKLSRNEDMIFS